MTRYEVENSPAGLDKVLTTEELMARLHELSARLMQREEALRESEIRLAHQKSALELAVSGASIDAVLKRIVRMAREQSGEGAGAALFILNAEERRPRLGAAEGMSEEYTRAVEEFDTGPTNPFCGSAAYTGQPVIVSEVANDPLWAPYLPLAREHCIRACWSFPIRSFGGKTLGTLEVYHGNPGKPRPGDLEAIGLLAQTAALVLEQYKTAEECKSTGEALHRSEWQLKMELADTGLLQDISAEFVQEENIEALYEKIVDAAVAIMRSDYASMQMLYPERGGGELRLLAFRGFNQRAAKFWEWVRVDSNSTCGAALRTAERVIVPDVEQCDFMAGTEDQATCLQTGIRAVQTTPLVSRGGKLVGMISTQWRRPHEPSQRDLRLLDILARQAADLIERRKSEDAILRQRRLYESILNNTPDLAYVFNLNHRFIYANEGLLKMWGKTWDEAIGKNCLELGYEPWHAEMHDREIDQVIATREPVRGQVPFRGTFGRRIYDYIFVPVLNANGEVEAVAGTTRDVTDIRAAEEALRFHREKIENLLNAAPLGVYLVDAEFRISEANPIALAAFGDAGGPEFVIGRRFDDVMHLLWPEDYADEVIRIFRHTLETGESYHNPERMENRIERGTTEYYEWRIDRIPLPEGRHGAVCYFRNISAQVRGRVALAESEERFRTLADNITQIAWTADEKGEILWYNRRWLDYTGLTVEEANRFGPGTVLHPDHLNRVVKKYYRQIQKGEAWEDTFPMRGHDGEFRWFLSRAVPIRDGGGKILRWFGTNTDITEQMQASEALREADRKKDEFLAMLSHELRNPMAPIFNALQLMSQEGESEVQRETRTVIHREMRHLSRLVNDLLEVTRITTGKIQLQLETVELNAIVERAVARLLPQINGHSQELFLTLVDGDLRLQADATRLEQVIGNLLHNASKYNGAGGHIWLTVERVDDQAVIRVRDDGLGIAPGIMPNIFELFTQANPSLDRTDSGLGIGLALVKSLVELHGGAVEAYSKGIDCGSEFTVRIPVNADISTRCEPSSQAVMDDVAPLKVLVVDDHVDTARMSALVLTSWSHEVQIAHEGPDALQKINTFHPDVVLMDIGMPHMDGYEVARLVRRDPRLQPTLLVAITGYGHDIDLRRSKEAGFDFHLVKPVEPANLKKLLAGYQEKKQNSEMN